MMTIHGVSTQTFSAENNKIQIERLEALLYQMELDYRNPLLKIPDVLKSIGLKNHGDISMLYEDIRLQLYKFHEAKPGEMVKLTSMVAASYGISAFATRDDKGDFQIVLGKINHYYQINIVPIQAWQRHQGLFNRMEHFGKNPPQHLQPYIHEKGESYELAVKQYQDDIDNMYLTDSFTIPKNAVSGQAHALRVIRTTPSEFEVLLETDNPAEPYIRFDSAQKQIWRFSDGSLMDENAINFMSSLEKASANLRTNGMSSELASLIRADQLDKIYQYLSNNPFFIRKLCSGQSFRLPKELTRLARTLNIVREPNGELMLMLETKRKKALGSKDKTRTIGQGSFGTVKPCWRIDNIVPEEWVNKVMKNTYAQEADYEAIFSQNLIESPSDTKNDVLNISMLGELFTSKNVVKRSQYAKRAIGDLKGVMHDPNIKLTNSDKKRITENILDGLAALHKQGKVHQDLKLQNIFIYQDDKGYYAKVADFGISYDPKLPLKKPSLASGGYESPEIIMANESPKASYHSYYYGTPFIQQHSYAYQLHTRKANRDPESPEAIEFRKPDPSNDMWAVGILLFELTHGSMPRFGFSVDEQRINENPLIKGLLSQNRSDRLNIQQAININQKMDNYNIISQTTSPQPARQPPIIISKATTHANQIQPASPLVKIEQYANLISVQYVDLGNIQGQEGRIKRDAYIYLLKKVYDNDPALFNLILDSQTNSDLLRLHQSLVRYVLPPKNIKLLYPELIKSVKEKVADKTAAIAKGDTDVALASKGKVDVEQYVKGVTANQKKPSI